MWFYIAACCCREIASCLIYNSKFQVLKMAKRKTLSMELISLCRGSFASHSASEKLLAHVRKHGLPESSSKTAQFKARKDVCRGQRTEYGCHIVDLPVPLTNGLTKTMPFQNPLAFFNYNCKHSADYASVVAKRNIILSCSISQSYNFTYYSDYSNMKFV